MDRSGLDGLEDYLRTNYPLANAPVRVLCRAAPQWTQLGALVLRFCDAASDHSVLLQFASAHNHKEMFDDLWPLSDGEDALADMQAMGAPLAAQEMLVQRLEIARTHDALRCVVDDTRSVLAGRKKL